ncbi:hypothetical protein EST38_g13411 [Candolleomyces aberdarensis]|uniref:Transposase n=1 Tax=Candolleomyces aberdarensis TaxID=2316362 RepID=A0A4Q2D121_9AGAR|nr:hypothetical protein EST38_g13411 [Candolleomyces aberdarensis]
MAPHLTPTKRAKICMMKKAGYPNASIKAALIGRTDVTNRTIQRVYNRYGEKENFYDVAPKSGRPRKLTAHDARVAIRHLRNSSARNATELRQLYFPEVSVDTVKRELRRNGLEAHKRAKVPFISFKNLKVRRDWAASHLNWTVENWCAVTFSDESIFRVFGSDGIEWCWRKSGERLDPRFTKKKVKHGGGKVTVWGMITAQGVGRLVRIDGSLNASLYRDILQDDALGTFHDLGLDPQDHYFQQDNDPKHTSRIARTWFDENQIDLLPWPPSSPNINIIENLWDHFDRRIRARSPLPRSEEELWAALQEEWYKIEPSFIESLYQSLPDRVRAVYEAKGGNTRF